MQWSQIWSVSENTFSICLYFNLHHIPQLIQKISREMQWSRTPIATRVWHFYVTLILLLHASAYFDNSIIIRSIYFFRIWKLIYSLLIHRRILAHLRHVIKKWLFNESTNIWFFHINLGSICVRCMLNGVKTISFHMLKIPTISYTTYKVPYTCIL